MLFRKSTGHLCSCLYVPGNSINEPILGVKPVCCGEVDYRDCGGVLCYLGCLRTDDYETYSGYCAAHWKKYCKDNDWCSYLSYCANTKCDELGLNCEDRSKINSSNIKEKIN